MLVTFTCNAHENITMFGDIAVHLLKKMGQSGTVPGAILIEDIPAALTTLTQSIEQDKQQPSPAASVKGDDDDDEPSISLRHRALPLIELLQSAIKGKCNVMWKEGTGPS